MTAFDLTPLQKLSKSSYQWLYKRNPKEAPNLATLPRALSPIIKTLRTLSPDDPAWLTIVPHLVAANTDIPEIVSAIRPIYELLHEIVKTLLAQGPYSETLDQIVSPEFFYGRSMNFAWPTDLALEVTFPAHLAQALAEKAQTREDLAELLALKHPKLHELTLALAPAFADPDTTLWYLSKLTGKLTHYTSTLESHGISFSSALLKNPHTTAETRSALGTHLLSATLSANASENKLSPAERQFVYDSLDDSTRLFVRQKTIRAIVDHSEHTPRYIRTFKLHTDPTIQSLLADWVATDTLSAVSTLKRMASLLPLELWQKLVLAAAPSQAQDNHNTLKLLLAKRAPSDLTPIFSEVISKVRPAFLPHFASMMDAANWELLAQYYARRRSTTALESLLTFLESTTPEVRANLPRALLVRVFKNADTKLKSRALALLPKMKSPAQSLASQTGPE